MTNVGSILRCRSQLSGSELMWLKPVMHAEQLHIFQIDFGLFPFRTY